MISESNMHIGSDSACIAGRYIYNAIDEITTSLSNYEVDDDDVPETFMTAMALCSVLSQIDSALGSEAENLIHYSMGNYPEELQDQLHLEDWC